MYAIVRAGGRQEKVAVGDVDEGAITADPAKLAKVKVTAEVVGHERGPKINILRYKNKTGYRRRQGHRQDLTRVKVTAIETKA